MHKILDVNIVFLSTGTNIGNRQANLDEVNKRISQTVGTVVAQSGIYETEAWGLTDQQDFYNQVLLIHTPLSPTTLLQQCHLIEEEMGRKRKKKWGPRLIDIDVLFYNDMVIDQEGVQIPHPRLHLRNFVLLPLCELNADWVHPLLNKKMHLLLQECQDDLQAKRVNERV